MRFTLLLGGVSAITSINRLVFLLSKPSSQRSKLIIRYDLKSSGCSFTVKVSLLQFCEATNVKRGRDVFIESYEILSKDTIQYKVLTLLLAFSKLKLTLYATTLVSPYITHLIS